MIIRTPKGGEVNIASAARPSDPWGAYTTILSDTFAGRNVTPEGALALTAVFGATSLIANTCGTLPLETHDKTVGKRTIVQGGRLAPMLRYQPNEDMPASTYWTLVFAHLCLRGNHYAAKIRGADGEVRELYPISPDSVHPFRGEGGRKLFRVHLYDGSTYMDYVFTKREILHIMGPSFDDGLQGASPIAVARNRLGVQLAQSEFQARFYQDGAMMQGVLSTPNDLSPEAAERIKTQWRARHAGLENAHDIAVLHSGAQYQGIGVSPEDQQLIESMKWGATEIATLFNIPASRINADSGSNSIKYANSGQDDLHFAKSAVLPRLKFVEDALNCDPDLFGFQSPWEPKFNVDSVLRADIKTRYESYAIGLSSGFLHRDEVREAEDLDPRSDLGEASGGAVNG